MSVSCCFVIYKPGQGSSSTLAIYTYGYNAASEITTELNQDGSYTYTYDKTGQLTGVDASGGTCGATGCDESFAFDVNGNRTMTGYTTGTGNGLTSDGTYNYTYDDNGNMLTKTRISDSQKSEFTWDYRNRLAQVVMKDSSNNILQQSDFTYDAFDRRIIKSFDDDGSGPHAATVAKTLYDGASFDANPYADFDGSSNLTIRYLYGPQVDFILSRRDASGTVGWHLADHLGSVRDVLSTTGAVLDHISYSSFGRVTAETASSNGDRFKFTGREFNSEHSTYFYRARSYDPADGRFTGPDPIVFGANDTNLYRYIGNSPLGASDPLGLEPIAPEPAVPPPDPPRVAKPLPDEELTLGPRRTGATLKAGSIPLTIAPTKKTNQGEMIGPASLFVQGGQMVIMAVPGPRVRGSVSTAAKELPVRGGSGPTTGVIYTETGPRMIQSGAKGAAQNIPRGTPGFTAYTRTHVEGHVAAQMRSGELPKEVVLHLNNLPCGGTGGCLHNIETMIPPGSKLTIVIHEPVQDVLVFVGNAVP